MPMMLSIGGVVAAVFQYAPAIISYGLAGSVILTGADTDFLESGGLLRYIKDIYIIFVICISIFYFGYLTREPTNSRVLLKYLLWLVVLLTLGLLPLLFVNTAFIFIVAGVRWLLLLTAGVCLFAWAAREPLTLSQQSTLAMLLIMVCAVDLVEVFLQARTAGDLYGIAVGSGAIRIAGFMTQAGVAGTFAILIAMLSLVLAEAGDVKRLILLFSATIISLAAGSRFGLIVVMLMFYGYLDERLTAKGAGHFRLLARGGLLLGGCAAAFYLYGKMNEFTDRGDLMETQTSEGGRVANLIKTGNLILEFSFCDVFFGQGIGVGTNTVVNMLATSSELSGNLTFNQLADNTVVTIFYQFGIFGSAVLWAGVWAFWKTVCVGSSAVVRVKQNLLIVGFLISIISTNLFEQFFLVIGFPLVLGISARFNSAAGRRFPASIPRP